MDQIRCRALIYVNRGLDLTIIQDWLLFNYWLHTNYLLSDLF